MILLARRTLVCSYFWQNTIGADAVITADGYIVLNGVAQADDAGGYWLFDNPHTTLKLIECSIAARVADLVTSRILGALPVRAAMARPDATVPRAATRWLASRCASANDVPS